MAQPHTLENTLRVHDVAVFNWVGKLRVDYGAVGTGTPVDRSNFPILRVMAGPERAFARAVDLLVRMGWIDGATAAAMRDNAEADFAVLPLPIVTIRRGDAEIDPELSSAPKTLRTRFFNVTTGQWEFHPWPGFYRTPYTLSFWMDKKYTDAYVREWLMSQFGQLGSANAETFVMVEHDPPWGSQLQALRFDGTSDNSELEGENQRAIRFDVTVNLRTAVFRVSDPDAGTGVVDGEYPIDSIGWDVAVESTAPDTLYVGGEDSQGPSPELYQSENYWIYKVPENLVGTVLSATGNATVVQGEVSPPNLPVLSEDLLITAAVQADKVEIGEWPTCMDDDGVAIYGVSFWYLSKYGRMEMEVLQRDVTDPVAPTFPDADSFVLPKTLRWEQFHRFFVVRGENGPAAVANRVSLILRFAGIPNQPSQELHLHRIDIRRTLSLTKVAASNTVVGGGETVYEWTGLARAQYLVIMVTATTSGGYGRIRVSDDLTHPTFEAERDIDATVNAGAAFLIQPYRGDLALHVPDALSVEDVYIQQFHGRYAGHTVGF